MHKYSQHPINFFVYFNTTGIRNYHEVKIFLRNNSIFHRILFKLHFVETHLLYLHVHVPKTLLIPYF